MAQGGSGNAFAKSILHAAGESYGVIHLQKGSDCCFYIVFTRFCCFGLGRVFLCSCELNLSVSNKPNAVEMYVRSFHPQGSCGHPNLSHSWSDLEAVLAVDSCSTYAKGTEY